MLAQLEQRSDVDTAQVDRRGERLRIRLRPGGTLSTIREALERMGFAADEAPAAEARESTWYGAAEVGELSREEGRVIAARVVPPFVTANRLGDDRGADLEARVADALYACFTERADALLMPGGIAKVCGPAVERAATPLIGADRAAMLARAVEADMTGASSA